MKSLYILLCFFCFTLSLSAHQLSIEKIDSLGQPVLVTNANPGQKFYPPKADKVLLDIYKSSDFQLLTSNETCLNDDDSKILFAIYSRVATADDSQKIRKQILSKYLKVPLSYGAARVAYSTQSAKWSDFEKYLILQMLLDEYGFFAMSDNLFNNVSDDNFLIIWFARMQEESGSNDGLGETFCLLAQMKRNYELCAAFNVLSLYYKNMDYRVGSHLFAKTKKELGENHVYIRFCDAVENKAANATLYEKEILKLADENFYYAYLLAAEIEKSKKHYGNAAYYYYMSSRKPYSFSTFLLNAACDIDNREFQRGLNLIEMLYRAGHSEEAYRVARYYLSFFSMKLDERNKFVAKIRTRIPNIALEKLNQNWEFQRFYVNQAFEERFQKSLGGN